MNPSFAPYINLYVHSKSKLFPLIETYSGESLKGASHGKAVGLYVKLLDSDQQFRDEINKLIEGNYKNTGGTAGTLAMSLFPGTTSTPTTNVKVQGPIASILSSIGGVWESITKQKTAETEQENLLYGAILSEQNKSDTGKIILVSVITLAFIGVGAWLVVKMNKK